MSWSMNSEIRVPTQKVRQKPKPNFKRDAFRDFALRHGIQDHIHHRFMVEGEIYLSLGFFGAVEMILLNCLLQRSESLAGIVKVRNGLVQPFAGQIHQQSLKLAECPA